MANINITLQQIQAYQRDGVALIPGLFKDHVNTLCHGIDRSMAEPGTSKPTP